MQFISIIGISLPSYISLDVEPCLEATMMDFKLPSGG